ncbi:hypothetical protein [Blastochloris viridis]|uniref:hypothetical protein n=1 Tax=Blastochloris viridis TaxID=1079 RepID=UPI0012E11C17|nr:hypothetical protein [Blastochloris viridis]
MEHWSDCALHAAGFACDCGGLQLADYAPERFRVADISIPGRVGFFVDLGSREGFVEAHCLPTDTLVAIAAATNLPDAHGEVASSRFPNGVNLNNPRKAVVAQLKALTASQR